jgi:molybdate transport system regulatory protein
LTDVEAIHYNSYMPANEMKLMWRVWLDNDGKAFGEGPDRLLRRVETAGSLHKAAAEMKMSYRKAWLMLRAMEQRLGFPLLVRKVGGVSGGGSQLTPEARNLMKRYEAFRREFEGALHEIYAKHFG